MSIMLPRLLRDDTLDHGLFRGIILWDFLWLCELPLLSLWYPPPSTLPFFLKSIWNQRSLTGKGWNNLYLLNRHLFIEQNSEWMYSKPVCTEKEEKDTETRNRKTLKQEHTDYTSTVGHCTNIIILILDDVSLLLSFLFLLKALKSSLILFFLSNIQWVH